MVQVEIEDHTEEVLAELKRRTRIALNSVGASLEKWAKEKCPVDTGRLKNSITFATYDNSGLSMEYTDDQKPPKHYTQKIGKVKKENEVYVGTNVEYAPEIEENDFTHKVGQAHFLRDSIATHQESILELLEKALKD